VSVSLQLPAPTRTEVPTRILDVLPDTLGVASDLTLHLARRV